MDDYMDENGNVKILDPYFGVTSAGNNGGIVNENIEEIKKHFYNSDLVSPSYLTKDLKHKTLEDAAKLKELYGELAKQEAERNPGIGNDLDPGFSRPSISAGPVYDRPINVIRPIKPSGQGSNMFIDIMQLQQVSANLKRKGNAILNTYKQDCFSALQKSSECLKITGIDCKKLFDNLNEIYTNINNKLTTISNFIDKDVITSYDAAAKIISDKFNGELATEIKNILASTNSK